jgi:hypothetical protein
VYWIARNLTTTNDSGQEGLAAIAAFTNLLRHQNGITLDLTASGRNSRIERHFPEIQSPKRVLEESCMRWVFGLSLLWCVAMFVAVALCRAAGASEVHERAIER